MTYGSKCERDVINGFFGYPLTFLIITLLSVLKFIYYTYVWRNEIEIEPAKNNFLDCLWAGMDMCMHVASESIIIEGMKERRKLKFRIFQQFLHIICGWFAFGLVWNVDYLIEAICLWKYEIKFVFWGLSYFFCKLTFLLFALWGDFDFLVIIFSFDWRI